jgi:hypothetical protein
MSRQNQSVLMDKKFQNMCIKSLCTNKYRFSRLLNADDGLSGGVGGSGMDRGCGQRVVSGTIAAAGKKTEITKSIDKIFLKAR